VEEQESGLGLGRVLLSVAAVGVLLVLGRHAMLRLSSP